MLIESPCPDEEKREQKSLVVGTVDFFLVPIFAGAGDELQGIKKGILELADLIAINKADGPNLQHANQAAREYQAALHNVRPTSPNWSPPVLTCSALTGHGLESIWDKITAHREALSASGELDAKRRDQKLRWMWSMIDEGLRDALRRAPGMIDRIARLESDVRDSRTTPALAAREVLGALREDSPRR